MWTKLSNGSINQYVLIILNKAVLGYNTADPFTFRKYFSMLHEIVEMQETEAPVFLFFQYCGKWCWVLMKSSDLYSFVP